MIPQPNTVASYLRSQKLFIQVLQLTGLTLVAYLLNIEHELGLQYFLILTLIFFPIHSLVSIRLRPMIQIIYFLITIFLFLSVLDAIFTLILILIYFGIFNSSLPYWIKIGLTLILSIYLFLCRFEVLYSPFSPHVIVTAAGILMFRSIVFLYDRNHFNDENTWIRKLNYFLLAPNIIFPLFPIVDYQKYTKSFYDSDAEKIYQKGIQLILWSLICLLIYRYIYYFLMPDAMRLSGVLDVSKYMIMTYLTVIRLIGILSLSVGIMRLFGYHLPEIFNFLFLANSFSDVFKRINLYWKDFILKIGYYPVYFALRKRKVKLILLYSLVAAFFLTWFFHIYQWAWILGHDPVRGTGVAYWAIFGALAIWGSMRSKETNKVEEINLRQSFFQGSKILGTFLGMSVLYTLWIHATFQSWWVYFQIAARSSWAEWIVWFGLMVSIALMIGFMHFYLSKEKLKFSDYMNQHVNRITSLLIILFILGTIGIHSSHSPSVEIFVDNEKLNVNDTRSQSEGYYESILRADISSKLWDDDIDLALIKRKETLVNFIEGLYDKLKPNADEDQSVGIHETSNIYQSDPYIYKRFKANFNGRYRRKSLITNDLGLRDTTYTKVRTKPTVRVALIGSSPDMGYGVEGNEMYEYLAEKEVNEYAQVDSLELINFSFVDQGLLTQVYNLEALVLDYKPDYCIFVEHYLESDKENDRLDKMLRHGGKIYPALREELDRIHITDDKIKTRQLNDEYYDHLCIWAYHRIATLCREHHIKPVLMYLPAPGVNNRYDAHVSSFTNEGFQIINLNDIFEKYKPDELILSPKDHHPNAQGHWIIKDRVKRELIKLLNMH